MKAIAITMKRSLLRILALSAVLAVALCAAMPACLAADNDVAQTVWSKTLDWNGTYGNAPDKRFQSPETRVVMSGRVTVRGNVTFDVRNEMFIPYGLVVESGARLRLIGDCGELYVGDDIDSFAVQRPGEEHKMAEDGRAIVVKDGAMLIIDGPLVQSVSGIGRAGICLESSSSILSVHSGSVKAIAGCIEYRTAAYWGVEAGPGGAGIGGDKYMDGGTVNISGGSVVAVGSQGGGAGIGGGLYGNGGKFKMTGGKLQARSNSLDAAAIGGGGGTERGGYFFKDDEWIKDEGICPGGGGGEIKISGGTLNLRGTLGPPNMKTYGLSSSDYVATPAYTTRSNTDILISGGTINGGGIIFYYPFVADNSATNNKVRITGGNINLSQTIIHSGDLRISGGQVNLGGIELGFLNFEDVDLGNPRIIVDDGTVTAWRVYSVAGGVTVNGGSFSCGHIEKGYYCPTARLLDITVNGGSLTASGKIDARNITVGAGGALSAAGITVENNLTFAKGTLTAASITASGITLNGLSAADQCDVTGAITATEQLKIGGCNVTAASLSAKGIAVSGGGVTAASLAAGDSMTVSGGVVDAGTLTAGGSMTVSGGGVDADTLTAGGSMTVSGGGVNADTLTAGGSMTVSGGTVTADSLAAGDSMTVSGGTVTADCLTAENSMDISGCTVTAGSLAADAVNYAGGNVTADSLTTDALTLDWRDEEDSLKVRSFAFENYNQKRYFAYLQNGAYKGSVNAQKLRAEDAGRTVIPMTRLYHGSGTAADPYTIADAGEWGGFSWFVAHNDAAPDACYALAEDYDDSEPITAMVGQEHPFRGVFDGRGKTVTANIQSSGRGEAAPFLYTDGATIKNLTVAGRVIGRNYVSGLIGQTSGNTTIENCVVSAYVETKVHGGPISSGGIVRSANASSHTTIKDSVFNGTINLYYGYTHCGLFGKPEDSTASLTFENCLFNGSVLNTNYFFPIVDLWDLSILNISSERLYYTVDPIMPNLSDYDRDWWLRSPVGAKIQAEIPEGVVYEAIIAVDHATYYAPARIEGIQRAYAYTGSAIDLGLAVKSAEGVALTEGTDFEVTTDPAVVSAVGTYTLTVAGKGAYTGSQTMTFRVTDSGNYTWSELHDMMEKDGEIILMADVIAGEDEDTYLHVPVGKHVVLDLNGHTINGEHSDGSVITVDGELTLRDSSGGGMITGGNDDARGGGICVYETAVFNMEGGTICGNQAPLGGGVAVFIGTFNMTGGSICDNQCTGAGGGLLVEGGTANISGGLISGNTSSSEGGGIEVILNESFVGSVVMSGGSVTDNHAGLDGGGVHVVGSSFVMSGGSITDNTATRYGGGIMKTEIAETTIAMTGGSVTGNVAGNRGGGLYCAYNINSMTVVSGSPVVMDNTLSDGTASNVYLDYREKIIVSDPLGETAHLGVTLRHNTDVVTSGLPGNGTLENFVYDDGNYRLWLNGDGEAEVRNLKRFYIYRSENSYDMLEPMVDGSRNTYPWEDDTVTLVINAPQGYRVGMPLVNKYDKNTATLGDPVPVTDIGEGRFTFVMPASDVYVQSQNVWLLEGLDGSGTWEDFWQINSAEDWDTIATWINTGNSVDDMFFQLNADIQISEMWGTEAIPFTGTFNGMGYTLELALDGGDEIAAPFRYVRGAQIYGVNTRGTVRGGAGSAGLIGIALGGENLIRSCRIGPAITASGAYCGGVIGDAGDSSTTFNMCWFSGSVSGATNMGIFQGAGSGTATLVNCLDISENAAHLGIGGTVNASNSYYTDSRKAAAGGWANAGKLAYVISDAYSMISRTGSVGLGWRDMLYVAEGETIRFSCQQMEETEGDECVVLSGEGIDALRLTPDGDGLFSFVMPGVNLTATPGWQIHFVDWDGTELQSTVFALREMPVYAGADLERARDAQNFYTFTGWSPEIASAYGEMTYTANYQITPVFHLGENTVHLEIFHPVDCQFTPEATGHYRIWAQYEGFYPYITVLDDGGEEIAQSHGGDPIQCPTGELEAGRTYTIRVGTYADEVDVTFHLVTAIVHNVSIDESYDHTRGVVTCEPTAWVGQTIPFEVLPNEDFENDLFYGIGEVTVTRDSDGQLLPVGDYRDYVMPDDDVTIHVRFDPNYRIYTEENERLQVIFINGRSVEASPREVAGTQIEAVYWHDPDYMLDTASITTAEGVSIPYRLGRNHEFTQDDEYMGTILFTMPASPVTITVTTKPIAFANPDFTLPAAMTTVGAEAFEGIGASAVYIPDTCGYIDDYAFRNCPNLTMIRIPADCGIGWKVFEGCPWVYVFGTPGSDAERYCEYFDNCVFVPE